MSARTCHRLPIVGVVVAGREHVGAEQDAARDFGAEAAGARGLVHAAQAVARQRAARTGRHRSAPGWTTPRRARRCSRPGSRATCAAARRRASPHPTRCRRSSAPSQRARMRGSRVSGKYSLGRPMTSPRATRSPPRGSRAPASVGAGGVVRVVAGDHLEPERGVVDRAPEDADLVERRRERDEPEAAHAAVRRLDADDAAERRRLPHRAAGLGAERDPDDARRDGGGRTA